MFYFEANLMESQENKGLLRHVKVVDSLGDAVSEVKPGYLVTVKGLATNSVYGTSIKNQSVFEVTAPTTLKDRLLIVDLDDVPTTKIGGNTFKFLPLNYGISTDGDKPVRARVLEVDDIFTVSDENFVTAPTTQKYAIATKDSFKFTAVADDTALATALPDGGFYAKIEEIYDATTGAESGFKKIVCRVVSI